MSDLEIELRPEGKVMFKREEDLERVASYVWDVDLDGNVTRIDGHRSVPMKDEVDHFCVVYRDPRLGGKQWGFLAYDADAQRLPRLSRRRGDC